MADLADDVKAALRQHADFPAPGVTFQDIGPLLAQPKLLERVVAAMAEPFAGRADAVLGVESRGFILGVPVALRLGVPFVPARKRGKLPGAVLHEAYALEYGDAALEVQEGMLRGRVLVVDDVLATGGTARAAATLVERAGAEVAGWSFLLEIAALRGRARLDGDVRVVASA